uniref:Midkine n=1 Tax=Canis lupus familiaris TaxID=9615 RepID=A0A8I3PZB0_CANLF
MFTAGCDSVKWIFFLSALLFLRRRSSRSSGVWLGGGGPGTGHPGPRPLPGGDLALAWGRGLWPARGLTSAWRPSSAGPRGGADFLSLPASRRDDNNESEREVGGGRGPDSSAPWPRGLGQAPSPRPQRLSLFRARVRRPRRPRVGRGGACCGRGGRSGTSQTALVSSEPHRLQARVPSRPRARAPSRGGAPSPAAAGSRRAGPRRGYTGLGAGRTEAGTLLAGRAPDPDRGAPGPLQAAQRAGAAAASWGRGGRGGRGPGAGRPRARKRGAGGARRRSADGPGGAGGVRDPRREAGLEARGRGAGAEAGTPGSGGGAGLRGGGGAGPPSGGCGGRGGGGGPCDRLRPVLETKGAAAAGAGRARRGRERSTAGSERVSGGAPRPRAPAEPPPRGGLGVRAVRPGWRRGADPTALPPPPPRPVGLGSGAGAGGARGPPWGRGRAGALTRPVPAGCSSEASSSSPSSPCWRSPPRWPKRKVIWGVGACRRAGDARRGRDPGKPPPSESELRSPCVLDKVKKGGPGSECAEWTWGPCTPSSKDCGVGFREGTCGAQTQRIRCRVPCNWKKEFGADCKYKFENWGACDGGSGTKARQGTLKKARYNAQCQETIRVTKPCTPKTKAKAKAKKGKGKD